MKTLKPSAVAVALALTMPTAFADTQSSDVSDVVVVTATQNEISLKDAPASVTVVTNEELNRLPATNIATALKSVTGVRVQESTGSESKIVIRGLKNQYSSNDNFALVLVNGRRMSSSETVIRGAGFDLSSIPMSLVERVEVIRGPMSALYGSEAIGGVVNIILKQPDNETEANWSLTYNRLADDETSSLDEDADGALINQRGFVSGALIEDKLFYMAALDISDRNAWFPDDAGTSFSPKAAHQRESLSASLSWLATDSATLIWDFGYSNDERDEASTRGSRFFESEYDTKKLTSGIAWEHQWDWGNTELRHFYERTDVEENHWHPAIGSGDITQKNHSFDGKAGFEIGELNDVTLGFDFAHTKIENPRNYPTGAPSVSQAAIFVQDELAFNDQVTLTLSGRFTDHQQFGSNVSPRAYLVFNATDSLTFKGGYAEGFKAPTLFQSDKSFKLISCGGRCYLVGNPDLKPQTSRSYELTTMFTQPTWFVQGTLFHNQVKNLIDRDLANSFTVGNETFIQYVNFDRVETQGVELESQFDVTDSVFLTANATFTKTEDKLTGKTLAYSPELLANITLNWLPNYDWSIFFSENYIGKQQDGAEKDLSAYSISNLGASYQVSDVFAVKAGITNVFDKRLDKENDDYEELEFGRSYFVTLDLTF